MLCKKYLQAPFLRRYIQTRKVHKKNSTSWFVVNLTPRRLDRRAPKLVCRQLSAHAISVIPPLLNTITLGRVHVKKKKHTVSQLRLQLPTNQFWDASVKAPGSQVYHKLGGVIFLVFLACLDISSKKRCLQDLFTYHLKAHTISNKLVSKVFALKNGKKSYDSYKYVFKFRWFQVQSPLNYFSILLYVL